jgi:hypothetical protein
VAYADVVVLNKTDLVVRSHARTLARHARIALMRSLQPQSEADVAAVEAAVRGINAAATVVHAQRSVVDLDLILDVGTLSPAAGRLLLPPAAPAAPPQAAFARGAEKLLAASAAHDARVGTVCLSARGGLDEAQLRTWLVRRSCCVSQRVAHSLTGCCRRRIRCCGSQAAAPRAWMRPHRLRCCERKGCSASPARRSSASCRCVHASHVAAQRSC